MPDLVHVTTDLLTGGSERVMTRLTEELVRRGWDVSVVSLGKRRQLGRRLESAGATVHALGGRAPVPGPSAWLGLAEVARRLRPAVVQGWMYHGNLASTLAWSARRPGIPVVWSVRQTLPELRRERVLTRAAILAGARASGTAARIIYNSHRSAEDHSRMGYKRSTACVIANGVDTSRFAPATELRSQAREGLGYSGADFVIGQLARMHPMKGHLVLLEAFNLVASKCPNVRLVLAGRGVPESAQIRQLVTAGLADRVRLLPEVEHPERLLPALDALCSPSTWGEAFPNVVAEAMSCAVPCVVTDVGDCARLVGDTGLVVQPGDVSDLAVALATLARGRSDCAEMGEKARERIAADYTLTAMVDKYERIYREVM